jgi:hypothetical protein
LFSKPEFNLRKAKAFIKEKGIGDIDLKTEKNNIVGTFNDILGDEKKKSYMTYDGSEGITFQLGTCY